MRILPLIQSESKNIPQPCKLYSSSISSTPTSLSSPSSFSFFSLPKIGVLGESLLKWRAGIIKSFPSRIAEWTTRIKKCSCFFEPSKRKNNRISLPAKGCRKTLYRWAAMQHVQKSLSNEGIVRRRAWSNARRKKNATLCFHSLLLHQIMWRFLENYPHNSWYEIHQQILARSTYLLSVQL